MSRVVNITTSIPLEMWNLAKEKHLKWNECLVAGINKLAKVRFEPAEGEIVYEESEISKITRAKETMQEHILKLNDEIDDLREKRNGRKQFP